MAKAKKRGKKKKSDPITRQELPGGWGRQVFAFCLIALSLLLIITFFSEDGTTLKAAFNSGFALIGWAMFLVMGLLAYLGILIFRKHDKKIAFTVWLASFLIIVWVVGFLGLFSLNNPDYLIGGVFGEELASFATAQLGLVGAGFVFVVFSLITIFFIGAINPADFFKRVSKYFSTQTKKEEKTIEQEAPKPFEIKKPAEEKPKKVKWTMFNKNKDVKIATSSITENTKPTKAPAPIIDDYIDLDDAGWVFPNSSLLEKSDPTKKGNAGNVAEIAQIIENTYQEFGISVRVEEGVSGPRVTQYRLKPQSGVPLSRIAALDGELALNLAAQSIRIEAPIPGTNNIGIEVPNKTTEPVLIRDVIDSPEWKREIKKSHLTFGVGKDIIGNTIVADLAKLPHLLIGGTTGSGKSVMLNTLLISLLFHNKPSDLNLIIVDPKKVEMPAYADIPHLIAPIINESSKALSALEYAVCEMLSRYDKMKDQGVKKIDEYNEKMAMRAAEAKRTPKNTNLTITPGDPEAKPATISEQTKIEKMPYLVVVIDEMSDLMMGDKNRAKEIEARVVRIAQLGRAAGVHVVLATQSPRKDIITGLIKANVPSVLGFTVKNHTESGIMLGQTGAEKLLNHGDALFLSNDAGGKPVRVQGAFISNSDLNNTTNYIREQWKKLGHTLGSNYRDDVTNKTVAVGGKGNSDFSGDTSNISLSGDEAERRRNIVMLMLEQGRGIGTSYIQRKFHISYGKAAGYLDELLDMGVLSPAEGRNQPPVLNISTIEEYDAIADNISA